MNKRTLLLYHGSPCFFVLVFMLMWPALMNATSAQARLYKPDKTYQIGFNKEPILKVFAKIEQLSGLKFSYSPEDIKSVAPITLEPKKRDIIALLKDLSSKSGLQFNLSRLLIGVTPMEGFQPPKKIEQPKLKAIVTDTLIQGLVTDSLNSGLPGVTVFVKNKTNIGTTTDLNGRYSLKVPQNASLVFKMIGFQVEERSANKPVINVSLREDNSNLNEVQVVAFGTQKKESVVGAITTIKPSELRVPSSNLTTALQGRIAGVVAYQRSGEPGQDNADFFIRGAATFGYKKDPLILIDGLELTSTDLARLQPNDIESFSVLKDATSSAVYGARAANGVILVTTKRGKEGKAEIGFQYDYSMSEPTNNIKIADPITYMKLHNEAISTRDPLGIQLYPQSKIDGTVAGIDPIRYPAVDWMDMLLKNQTYNSKANLSVRGGGRVATYFVTGTMNTDNGILKVDKRNNFNNNIKLKSYALRSNVDVNLTNTTTMAVRLYGNFDDYTGPINGGSEVYRQIMNSNPVMFLPYYNPDKAHEFTNHILFGNSENGNYLNPYAEMVKGYKNYSRSLMLAQIELKQDLSGLITSGLRARLMASTNRRSYFDIIRNYTPFYYSLSAFSGIDEPYVLNPLNETGTELNGAQIPLGQETLSYYEGPKEISTSSYMEFALNYDRTFGAKHNISGLLVGIMNNSLKANAGSLQASLPFRNIGFSGRFSYGFDSRYQVEFNFGYNGTERFYEDKRFGFFPSAGLAWNVSNEAFWQGLKSTVSNFKIRATYGLIGNDAIGNETDRFFYLSDVNLNDWGKGALFGQNFNHSRAGVSVNRFDNREITWERSKRLNLGVDFSVKDFNVTADYSTDDRSNILMTRAYIPTTMGLPASLRANVGAAKSKSFEASVDYTKNFQNSMWISLRANFTYAVNKYSKYEEPYYPEAYRSVVGSSISQQRGYIAERLFIDEQDIKNSPVQTFGKYMPGDIKYRDLNGDGVINEADKIALGFPTNPEIVYGFGFSAGYKNFDLSAFFSGLGRESFWINSDNSPFINNQKALLKVIADNHWSEDNRDLYAFWPRLSPDVISNNAQTSTWFMRNGAFLRLKQLELGYTLHEKVAKRLFFKRVRFYATANNLLTFSKFKLWDPELGGSGLNYPVQRVFNMGVNVSF
ncbi:TonB-dependent receptor [Pedobacter nyackensis]|uniref:SusC/RagA family TonB-linked outer membrane protein n=1 Tax=Pedobacter nyackensis TaxID=475255 RepID=UPI00292E042D|nr:TonB-dependent receptor [Pedobacter nyackensis]